MSLLSRIEDLVRTDLAQELEELTIERLVAGLFFTGVKLSNGWTGLSYTPIQDLPQAVCCPSSAGRIFDPVRVNGLKVTEVLPALSSGEPLKRAVALAALNALAAARWSRKGNGPFAVRHGLDALEKVDLSGDVPTVVIGALVPALRALKQRGGTWWVVEQDRKTLKPDELEHFVPFRRAKEVIGRAGILIVTGATILNQTLEPILDRAGPEARVVVMGPTVGLIPEPFFERGVDVLGGVLIRRPDKLLDLLAVGGSGYHFFDRLAQRVVVEPRPGPGFSKTLTSQRNGGAGTRQGLNLV